jgi:hypothetical protein
MSIHRIFRQHQGSSTGTRNAGAVARELTLNPLWVLTFAAGLLFGMLAVLLTQAMM